LQKKLFIIIPLALLAGLIFFMEAVFVLLPAGKVEEAIKDRLMKKTGLVMSTGSFEKVFPLGYEARGVRLASRKLGEDLYLTRVRARFSPLSLLRMRPGVIISGEIFGGAINGMVARGMKAAYINIDVTDAVLPPLKALGGSDAGVADIQLDITSQKGKSCPEGALKAQARGGRLREISIMGISIPGGEISEEGLDVKLARCRAYVKAAWIKSAAFSAEASGVLGPASPPAKVSMDLRIAFSPRGKLMEDLNKLNFLRPYRRSSGYYRAVLRGAPSAPVIRAE